MAQPNPTDMLTTAPCFAQTAAKRTVHFLDHITAMWTFPSYPNYTKKHAIAYHYKWEISKSEIPPVPYNKRNYPVTGIVSVNVSFHPQGRSLCWATTKDLQARFHRTLCHKQYSLRVLWLYRTLPMQICFTWLLNY